MRMATDLAVLRRFSGKLNVTAGGAITDSGNVSVAGTTTLAAGAAEQYHIGQCGSHLVGTVTITSGKDVTLNNDTALDLGASTITGKLDLRCSGQYYGQRCGQCGWNDKAGGRRERHHAGQAGSPGWNGDGDLGVTM